MIGIFDSGSGGLSVLRALRERAPHADVVYFGDIKNAPYGEKSAGELEGFARAGIQTLKNMGATEIIAACNSVSPAVLEGAAGDLPVIEMSRPAAQFMADYHEGERILLIATPATIASGLYERALEHIVSLISLPIADLAGAIEFGATEREISDILKGAFRNLSGEQFDGIFLGCTHFPLVRHIIAAEATSAFGYLNLINPAEAVARDAVKHFDTDGAGTTVFRISKDSNIFRRRAAAFTEGEPSIQVSS